MKFGKDETQWLVYIEGHTTTPPVTSEQYAAENSSKDYSSPIMSGRITLGGTATETKYIEKKTCPQKKKRKKKERKDMPMRVSGPCFWDPLPNRHVRSLSSPSFPLPLSLSYLWLALSPSLGYGAGRLGMGAWILISKDIHLGEMPAWTTLFCIYTNEVTMSNVHRRAPTDK